MSDWILGTVTSQLPGLIEKYQPAIESSLRLNLTKLKNSNPKETALFYTNWKKLNKAVEETLGGTTGGKRTRRSRRKHRK